MKSYYSLYFHNIRKFLKAKGKNFAVLGHLHTPHQEKDFTVIGTFHEGNIYEDDQAVAISDVHLGNLEYSPEQIEKLKSILSRTDKKVIIMGDFFDLFYAKPSELHEKYLDIIELIKKGNLTYLQGNHDPNITQALGIPSVREYTLGDKLFFHGHTCDPLYTLFPLNVFQYIRTKLGYRLHWLRPLYLKFHS